MGLLRREMTDTDVDPSGCEPLTPDDIAEIIVFQAGRRENVVIADTLVFPSHQVCIRPVPHTGTSCPATDSYHKAAATVMHKNSS